MSPPRAVPAGAERPAAPSPTRDAGRSAGVLAADYDLTLVGDDARLAAPTIAVLERLRAAGWALVVVTGRELDYLLTDLHRPDLFDVLVADNGVVLHRPATGSRRLLSDLELEPLRAALAARGAPAWGGLGTVGVNRRHEELVTASGSSPAAGTNLDTAVSTHC